VRYAEWWNTILQIEIHVSVFSYLTRNKPI